MTHERYYTLDFIDRAGSTCAALVAEHSAGLRLEILTGSAAVKKGAHELPGLKFEDLAFFEIQPGWIPAGFVESELMRIGEQICEFISQDLAPATD